jgi:hypothetical protein
MLAHKGWKTLGYPSVDRYARDRVGCSARSLRNRCALARDVERLPELGVALDSGAIGYETARLVARVATPETIEAWIDRAKRRTWKHLREEVDAVELSMRLGDEGPFLPPGEEELAAMAALERAALSGELFEGVLEATTPARKISVRAERGRQLRLRVSSALLEHFRGFEKRFERIAPPGASFIGFLGLAVWDAWLPAVRGMFGKWLDIHRRDCSRCQSPVCSRRDVTLHHLLFRSLGGGDEPWNTTSLCVWCHLEGIHGGRLRASPPASNIGWAIGRDPIMYVVGRERILLDAPTDPRKSA